MLDNLLVIKSFLFLWLCRPRVIASSFTRFLDHTQRRTTLGRTPLDEWSARRRDLYLTTHNTHNKHPCLRWDSNPNLSRRAATVTGSSYNNEQKYRQPARRCLWHTQRPVRLHIMRPVLLQAAVSAVSSQQGSRSPWEGTGDGARTLSGSWRVPNERTNSNYILLFAHRICVFATVTTNTDWLPKWHLPNGTRNRDTVCFLWGWN